LNNLIDVTFEKTMEADAIIREQKIIWELVFAGYNIVITNCMRTEMTLLLLIVWGQKWHCYY